MGFEAEYQERTRMYNEMVEKAGEMQDRAETAEADLALYKESSGRYHDELVKAKEEMKWLEDNCSDLCIDPGDDSEKDSGFVELFTHAGGNWLRPSIRESIQAGRDNAPSFARAARPPVPHSKDCENGETHHK